MKKIILISGLALLLIATPALADVYVKVDASGNAIGGAIMCDAGTCGAGSQYSQLTLQAGEQYVLQGTGHAGYGKSDATTQIQVDLQTNEWTITRQIEVKPIEPVVINDQQVISYTVQTVQTFTPDTNPNNPQPAPVIQPIPEPTIAPTPTPTLPPVETTTATATATTLSIAKLTKTFAVKPVVKKSTVIMATKNGIKVTKKEDAKALIRKKKK